MLKHDSDEDRRLTEDELRHVLARALEIERAGGTVSVAEVRAIAAEVGIDANALSKALSEIAPAEIAPHAPAPRAPAAPTMPAAAFKPESDIDPTSFSQWIGIATAWLQGVFIAAAPVVIGGSRQGYSELLLLALITMAGGSVALAIRARLRNEGPRFHLRSATRWLGFIAGSAFLLPPGAPTGDLVSVLAMCGLASTAVEFAVMKLGLHWRSTAPQAEPR